MINGTTWDDTDILNAFQEGLSEKKKQYQGTQNVSRGNSEEYNISHKKRTFSDLNEERNDEFSPIVGHFDKTRFNSEDNFENVDMKRSNLYHGENIKKQRKISTALTSTLNSVNDQHIQNWSLGEEEHLFSETKILSSEVERQNDTDQIDEKIDECPDLISSKGKSIEDNKSSFTKVDHYPSLNKVTTPNVSSQIICSLESLGIFNKALADLVTSWYYSGYYTGRYVAFDEIKQANGGKVNEKEDVYLGVEANKQKYKMDE